jgi:hypothetical protein
MKEEIINIIKILGVGCKEIILGIESGNIIIDSIELLENDDILIHHFEGELDFEIYFDDIELDKQLEIYYTLNSLLYN